MPFHQYARELFFHQVAQIFNKTTAYSFLCSDLAVGKNSGLKQCLKRPFA